MTLRSFGLLQKYRSRFWDFLSGRDGESPHIGEMGIGISAIKIQKSKLSAKMERMELMAKTDFPPMNYGNNLLLAAI